MQKHVETFEADPDAARQFIDARSVFVEFERTKRNARQIRGGMVWKSVKGNDYLIRTSTTGKQTSLGVKSEKTVSIYEKFIAQKQTITDRLDSLKETVLKHERLNRALRVGRMPNIVIAVLRRIAEAGLEEHFRVVGTHALYAYETAAGISFSSEITSTRDIDLLWDTRKRVVFSQRLALDSPSMLAALKKADKTFELLEDQKYTAVNKDGFEVDIIRRMAEGDDPHPIRLSDSDDDFWVVQARRASDLQNAPEFSEVVVGINGAMARMNTIDPRTFVEFKRWMSTQTDRESIKRRRDAMQADAVEWLIQERLTQIDPSNRS